MNISMTRGEIEKIKKSLFRSYILVFIFYKACRNKYSELWIINLNLFMLNRARILYNMPVHIVSDFKNVLCVVHSCLLLLFLSEFFPVNKIKLEYT